MPISVDWNTKVVTVPQAYCTPVSGSLYELDTNQFRLDLLDIMDSDGMPYPDPIRHNTEVTVAGVTFARTIEVINGYSVQFTPDSAWTVRLAGSNNNLFDVENGILVQNQVQVIANNSAGLVRVESLDAVLFRKIMTNKKVTDPVTGKLTIYDDDGTSVLLEADVFEDADGTQPYRSRGLERQEKLS